MKKIRVSLLGKVAIAISLGILIGFFLPIPIARVFTTINSLFGQFLSFSIPLIIVGLVTPAIGELGKGAGRLLALTAIIAYGSTIFSGFFTYGISQLAFPQLITEGSSMELLSADSVKLLPYFQVIMPPLMDVMTALVLSFTIGLGLTITSGETLKNAFIEFRQIITLVIDKVIIPLLPIYIFGIFLDMTITGQVGTIIATFIKVIAVIFVIHIALLLLQYTIAGAITHKNPLKLLRNMIPAYATALGTQSSAATIPVTMAQTIKNGVRQSIAIFTVPLCATIHLSGSTMKIVACAMAINLISGNPTSFETMAAFIFMLGITMVAAPGVPGGAIMAALGLLQSMLGFDETAQALMIALYIAMDSFGTACNVTGDGAISLVVDKIADKLIDDKSLNKTEQ
ncbi:MAG: dicarboxylate/amino acid:cation symporter [Bacteroidales bacterium]